MLVGALLAELAFYRRMDLARITQLTRIDMLYGISAGIVVLSGILRVSFGLKGAGFYLHNPIFWTKMALFLTLGLLSIPPTIHYLRIRGRGGVAYLYPLFATLLAHNYQ